MAAEADHVAVLRASHPERDGGYACNRDECITNPNLWVDITLWTVGGIELMILSAGVGLRCAQQNRSCAVLAHLLYIQRKKGQLML